MASVNIPHPESNLDGDSLREYLEKLVDQLEYILNNLDADNMTDAYNKKGGK